MKSLHLAPNHALHRGFLPKMKEALVSRGGGLCRKSGAAQKPNTINNHPIRLAKWTS